MLPSRECLDRGELPTKTWESKKISLEKGSEFNYEPVVQYSYTMGQQTYTSRRIAYGANSSGRGQAQKMIEQYPAGSTVTARYNPANRAEAVLETKAARATLFLILGIVFLALCAVSGCSSVVLIAVNQ